MRSLYMKFQNPFLTEIHLTNIAKESSFVRSDLVNIFVVICQQNEGVENLSAHIALGDFSLFDFVFMFSFDVMLVAFNLVSIGTTYAAD